MECFELFLCNSNEIDNSKYSIPLHFALLCHAFIFLLMLAFLYYEIYITS
jgi:hypothetical protein